MEPGALALTTAAVGAAYVLLRRLLRGRLSRSLSSAMAEGDYSRYRKVLFSRLTDLLVDRDDLCLLRAASLVSEGQCRAAETYLALVRREKLDAAHLMEYYRTAFSAAVQERDPERALKVQSGLKELYRTSQSPAVREQLADNQIDIRLYIRSDPEVAGEIVRRMGGQTGVRRGVSCLALAKARHLGGEDGKARQCLLEARELLVGTAYLPAIDAALADIKHLD